MGWKRWITAGIMSVVCLSLFIRPATAAGIKRFADSRGVIHITNAGGANHKTGAPGEDNQAPVPRLTFEGPEDKLIKMRALGITPPEENPAEPLEPPGSEAKITPADEENR